MPGARCRVSGVRGQKRSEEGRAEEQMPGAGEQKCAGRNRAGNRGQQKRVRNYAAACTFIATPILTGEVVGEGARR